MAIAFLSIRGQLGALSTEVEENNALAKTYRMLPLKRGKIAEASADFSANLFSLPNCQVAKLGPESDAMCHPDRGRTLQILTRKILIGSADIFLPKDILASCGL